MMQSGDDRDERGDYWKAEQEYQLDRANGIAGRALRGIEQLQARVLELAKRKVAAEEHASEAEHKVRELEAALAEAKGEGGPAESHSRTVRYREERDHYRQKVRELKAERDEARGNAERFRQSMYAVEEARISRDPPTETPQTAAETKPEVA